MGKCSFNNSEIARRLGISTPTVKKYNTYLIENGFLSEEVSNNTDEAGLPIITKNFNLTTLKQAALWIKAVNEQLINNTAQLNAQGEDIDELKDRCSTL